MVSTSRAGCTYFRRFLCNRYNLGDSGSWLKYHPYHHIEDQEWTHSPHVLKVLIHYIPKKDRKIILSDFDKIWLWREDKIRQFLSHVTRLRTRVSHVYQEKDLPDIQANSLTATRHEFDIFQRRQKEFWNLYHEIGFVKNEPLVKFEDFVNNPVGTCQMLEDWFYMEFSSTFDTPNKALPHKITIDYHDKFMNYDEIQEWFDE